MGFQPVSQAVGERLILQLWLLPKIRTNIFLVRGGRMPRKSSHMKKSFLAFAFTMVSVGSFSASENKTTKVAFVMPPPPRDCVAFVMPPPPGNRVAFVMPPPPANAVAFVMPPPPANAVAFVMPPHPANAVAFVMPPPPANFVS